MKRLSFVATSLAARLPWPAAWRRSASFTLGLPRARARSGGKRAGTVCASAFLLAALAVVVAGCAEDASSDEPRIEVEGAWARPSSGAGAGVTSAVYMVVRNRGAADRLTGVEGSAARAVELHRSTLEDGIMRMRRVDSADVPAGGELRLEPGGYHIMLIDLLEPLAPGDTVAVTLHFEQTGPLEVSAPVRQQPLP